MAAVPTAAGSRAILGVRPQYLHPGQFADRGHLHRHVRLVERLGTDTVLNVELVAGGTSSWRCPAIRLFDLGSEILVGFEPEKAHLFPVS